MDNDGSATIDSSTFASDVRIRLNTKTMKITKSSFSLEDVLIAKNDGPVIIDSNCDARPTIVENSHVMIINNKAENAIAAGATCTSGFGFSDADVSKNSSGVLIENNTGEGLYCTDNDPAPTDGRGNLITFSDGQCAGF